MEKEEKNDQAGTEKHEARQPTAFMVIHATDLRVTNRRPKSRSKLCEMFHKAVKHSATLKKLSTSHYHLSQTTSHLKLMTY